MKFKIRVVMRGQGIAEDFKAMSHEIKGYPGGTYHVFDMGDGRTTYYNDFGVRMVEIIKL